MNCHGLDCSAAQEQFAYLTDSCCIDCDTAMWSRVTDTVGETITMGKN